jgi:hypothetical protein
MEEFWVVFFEDVEFFWEFFGDATANAGDSLVSIGVVDVDLAGDPFCFGAGDESAGLRHAVGFGVKAEERTEAERDELPADD